MRVVIIGASFAGLTCLKKLGQLMPEAEFVLIDEHQEVGYIPNSLNWYYQGKIEQLGEFVFSREVFQSLNLISFLGHQVISIDGGLKEVIVEREGEEQVIAYDKLVCAMGASPQSSYIEGTDLTGVLTTKDYYSSEIAKEWLNRSERLVIVGTGPVGLEACHTYHALGKQVTLVEAGPRLNFRDTDEEMISPLLDYLRQHQVSYFVNERVESITESEQGLLVKTHNQHLLADAVLLAVNFRPNSTLLESQVLMNFDKTIIVDEMMRTSDSDIYAIGDLVSQVAPSGERAYIPLVSNAIRTAEQAAYAIYGYTNRPLLPSVKAVTHSVFGFYRSSLGQTEEEASLYSEVVTHYYDTKASMLSGDFLALKLIVSKKDGLFLGAQIIASVDVSPIVAQLVTAMSHQLTDKDLASQDFMLSLGHMELYYHLHQAVQAIFEKRIGICKSKA